MNSETYEERDAVCWHCLDCVTVPARVRCERCPEECDIEGCDAPGCNGQTPNASPWRSLRDDPPTMDHWEPVLLRDTSVPRVLQPPNAIVTWSVAYSLVRSDRAQDKLREGFTHWMKIPK